jgi:hypothetical protein
LIGGAEFYRSLFANIPPFPEFYSPYPQQSHPSDLLNSLTKKSSPIYFSPGSSLHRLIKHTIILYLFFIFTAVGCDKFLEIFDETVGSLAKHLES